MCVSRNGRPKQHRIWLNPDGTLSFPDHPQPWEHEQVVTALGGHNSNLCTRWREAAARLGVGKTATAAPATSNTTAAAFPLTENLLTWEYTQQALWRSATMWVANSALLGNNEYRDIPPPYALTVTQLYAKMPGAHLPPPHIFADVLSSLATPSSRSMWRTGHPIPPETVHQLLATGVDTEIVHDLAVLDIPAIHVARAVELFNARQIPHSWLLRTAINTEPAAFPAQLDRWQNMTAEQVTTALTLTRQHDPQRAGGRA